MGARRLLRSFGHALAGLGHVLRSEANARIHVAIAALVVGGGLLFGLGAGEWRWLILAIGLVWAGEAFNTAFEYLCDALSPQPSEAVKRAKDIAAGATLVLAVTAGLIGASIFWPYLF